MKNTNDIYIKFGTGEVEGYAGKDTVKIGNLIAHNQSFGIIVKESAESPINNPFKVNRIWPFRLYSLKALLDLDFQICQAFQEHQYLTI